MTYAMAQVVIEALLYSVAFFGLLVFIANIIKVPSDHKSLGESVKEAREAGKQAAKVKFEAPEVVNEGVFFYNPQYDFVVLKSDKVVLLGDEGSVVKVEQYDDFYTEQSLLDRGYVKIGEV